MEKKAESRRTGRYDTMNKKRNKGSGGFSLMEVIVSVVLLSILGGALTTMILGNSRVFSRNNQENRAAYELRAKVESGEKGVASGAPLIVVYEPEAADSEVWEEKLEEYHIYSEDGSSFMAYYE